MKKYLLGSCPSVWWRSEVIVAHLLERRAGPKVFHFPWPWQCRSFAEEAMREILRESEGDPGVGVVGPAAASSQKDEPADEQQCSQAPGIPGAHTEIHSVTLANLTQASLSVISTPEPYWQGDSGKLSYVDMSTNCHKVLLSSNNTKTLPAAAVNICVALVE